MPRRCFSTSRRYLLIQMLLRGGDNIPQLVSFHKRTRQHGKKIACLCTLGNVWFDSRKQFATEFEIFSCMRCLEMIWAGKRICMRHDHEVEMRALRGKLSSGLLIPSVPRQFQLPKRWG